MRRTLLLTGFVLGIGCLVNIREALGRNEYNRPLDTGEQIIDESTITIIVRGDGLYRTTVLKTANKDKLFIRCDHLKILLGSTADKKVLKLEGTGRVKVRGTEFQAQAERIIYDEQKDQITFIGSKDAEVGFTRLSRAGSAQQILLGAKLIYYRDSRGIDGVNVTSFRD